MLVGNHKQVIHVLIHLEYRICARRVGQSHTHATAPDISRTHPAAGKNPSFLQTLHIESSQFAHRTLRISLHDVLHGTHELPTVAFLQLTHGIDEEETGTVGTFRIFAFGVCVASNHLVEVTSLIGFVGRRIEGVLHLLAIATFELKVGVCHQLGMFIIRIAIYQPFPVVLGFCLSSLSGIELEHVVVQLIQMLKILEVNEHSLEGALCQWEVLHPVLEDDGRVVESIHQGCI